MIHAILWYLTDTETHRAKKSSGYISIFTLTAKYVWSPLAVKTSAPTGLLFISSNIFSTFKWLKQTGKLLNVWPSGMYDLIADWNSD